jgi:hypothetical protein
VVDDGPSANLSQDDTSTAATRSGNNISKTAMNEFNNGWQFETAKHSDIGSRQSTTITELIAIHQVSLDDVSACWLPSLSALDAVWQETGDQHNRHVARQNQFANSIEFADDVLSLPELLDR